MLVKDVMVEKVITASPNIVITEAAKIMKESNIGCLLIVEDERLVGLITDRDILTKVVAENKDITKTKISEVMTKEVIYINSDLDLDDAAKIMTENGIKKLPVIENDTLLGIITASDIIAAQPKIMDEIGALVLLAKREKPVAG